MHNTILLIFLPIAILTEDNKIYNKNEIEDI